MHEVVPLHVIKNYKNNYKFVIIHAGVAHSDDVTDSPMIKKEEKDGIIMLIIIIINMYGTAQMQLDARMRVAGSAPEGDISTDMRVPAGIFPVSSKACL